MDEKSLRASLKNLNIPEIRYFPTIGSTNEEALKWAEAGARDGSLVIADHQSAGRGRMGRTWITKAGTSLAISLIFRPSPEEIEKITLFSPLAALGLCHALDEMFGLRAMIKWPNDVLLDNKKVAGILVEGYWIGGTLQGMVIGIGINITRKAVPWNIKLLYPATSIEEISKISVDRIAFLKILLRNIFDWRKRLTNDEFLCAYERMLAFKGKSVTLDQPGQPPVEGQVIGINQNGDLRLQEKSGKIINVTAGDVSLRPL